MKVLFVCTGNTCRSPMAEGAFNSLKKGAISRGLMANEGEAASLNAIEAMKELGMDISGHKSHMLTIEDINEADLILTMTKRHKEAILWAVEDAKDKVFTLGEYAGGEDVSDPYGGDLEEYLACAKRIYEYVGKIVEKLG